MCPRSITFRLDGLRTTTPNVQLRDPRHVKVGRSRRERDRAYWSTISAMGRRVFALPLAITLTRIGPRQLDSDNNVGSLKAVRDGVAKALRVDDGDARIEWRYAQLKEKTYAVEVRIEEVPE